MAFKLSVVAVLGVSGGFDKYVSILYIDLYLVVPGALVGLKSFLLPCMVYVYNYRYL